MGGGGTHPCWWRARLASVVPALVAVGPLLQHGLHLLLRRGRERGRGLVAVRDGGGRGRRPPDGRGGAPLHLLFLLQLVGLQVHVRRGHGALHGGVTAAGGGGGGAEKQASLTSYRWRKT